MGSGINNRINEILCNPKNVKKRRNTRLEKCYGHVNIATAIAYYVSSNNEHNDLDYVDSFTLHQKRSNRCF